MTKYNSSYEGCLPFSDYTVQIALGADAGLSYTIPGDSSMSYRAEFSYAYNANVWVGYNTMATLPPSTAITTSSNKSIELRPSIRYVRGGDVLSFISDSVVSDCGLSLLSIPSG